MICPHPSGSPDKAALHPEYKPGKGKIEVVTTVPVETKDHALAYTPGVAQAFSGDPEGCGQIIHDLTRRWNMCLVVTDGSAVLGLGEIGPEAGMGYERNATRFQSVWRCGCVSCVY